MVNSRMSKIEHVDVVDGPVVSEGGRRTSAGAPKTGNRQREKCAETLTS